MKLHTYLSKLVALAVLLAAASVSAQDDTAGTNAAINAATNAEASLTTNATAVGTNGSSSVKERNPALAAAMAAAAANPAAATNDSQDTRLDARSFAILSTRNIFNPSRRAPVERNTGPPPPRIEYFTLNGVMTYEDKGYAFFDGSSGQYRRTLAHADSIAGYKIAGISNNLVKLAASSNQTITMSIGMQMRRTGDGPWKLESRGESTADSSASGGSDTNSDPNAVSPIFTGAQEDIVKKLMARRAEEEKKTGATNEDNKNDQNQ